MGRSSEPRRSLRASNLYDATQTNERNARHWANAQSYSPNGAAGPWARRILRERARYEAANNSYLAGILRTLANDTVGTGPRLQMQSGNDAIDDQVEAAFKGWCAAVRLADRLPLLRISKARDGEGIVVLRSNERLGHEVKLDLWLVEPEQVVDAHLSFGGAGITNHDAEGVEIDELGNATAYWILRDHPNALGATAFTPPQRVPAQDVLHYFTPERAGQWRGVTEIASALPLFASLRRYTLATVAAAENAANVTMVLKSNAMGDPEEHNEAAGDTLPLEAGGVPLMPAGYELQGFKPEQPTSTYPEFKREILNEIARCLNIPFNVAAADSSSYNYASGRLDHKVYFKSIRVEQSRIAQHLLDPLLTAFLREAVLVEGLFTPDVRAVIGRDGKLPAHAWFWDGFEHVDPVKDATADDMRLKNGSVTLAEIHGKAGHDWQQEIGQRARELAYIAAIEKKYNVSLTGGGSGGGSEGSDAARDERREDLEARENDDGDAPPASNRAQAPSARRGAPARGRGRAA